MKKLFIILLLLISSIAYTKTTVLSKIKIIDDSCLLIMRIDGYKFLVSSNTYFRNLSSTVIQMYEKDLDGKVVPQTCKNK